LGFVLFWVLGFGFWVLFCFVLGFVLFWWRMITGNFSELGAHTFSNTIKRLYSICSLTLNEAPLILWGAVYMNPDWLSIRIEMSSQSVFTMGSSCNSFRTHVNI
jgi:hypothetical protein